MNRPRHDLFQLLSMACLVLPAIVWGAGPVDVAPGDTVVVVQPQTQFGIRNQPMTALSPGQQLHVTEVRGKWIGGYVLGDVQQRLGWVNIAEVGTVEPAPPRMPTLPDVPDHETSVADLRKIGVRLQLDDRGRVQQISAAESRLTDADLVHLAGVPHLLSLDLTGQPITDSGLQHVARSAGLQKLYLSQTKISDAGLAHLRSLEWLEVLTLPQTAATGACLEQLSNLRNLRVLNLGHCQVTDDHLSHLARLNTIEVLALPYTPVTDAGLVHLKHLAKLRVLNLDGTAVTGSGFDNLLGLAELRMLYIRHGRVKAEQIEMLDNELAGLAIYD